MLYQKMITPVNRSTKILVFISSLGMLVSACGEKKKSESQSSPPAVCAEEKASTSKTTKKATTSKKDEVKEAQEAEEEESAPAKTTKPKKLAFSLQSTGTATSTSTSTSTTKTGVTYEKDIKSFWVASCVAGCHTSKGNTFPPLETWAEISAGAAAGVASTKTSKMPIGTASLTAAQKQLLLDWEAGGFLQGPPPTTGATGTQTATNTSTGTGADKKTPPVEEEEEEDEEEEEETPKTVKKAGKATATKADNCVDTKKAATSTKKATSKTTNTKTKKTTSKDEEE